MVNKLPSPSLPLVTSTGVVHPVWYEFFRNFESNTLSSISNTTTVSDISAGAGLYVGTDINTGADNFSVGQGAGIEVLDNEITVDISGQEVGTVVLDDEIMISDVSESDAIRKTRIRDVAALIGNVAGLHGQIQYNKNGQFGGDTGFSTDGAGNLNIDGTVSIADGGGDMIISGASFTTPTSSDPFNFQVPSGGGIPQFVFDTAGAGSSDLEYQITCNRASALIVIRSNSFNTAPTTSTSILQFANGNSAADWSWGRMSKASNGDFRLAGATLTTEPVFTVANTGKAFTHNTAMIRNTVAAITASTTRTQGQGALTGDINEISVCANLNDTVTLPAAAVGRYCLVINNGAQTLQVFPASGDNLGAGLNTSTTIVAASRKWFVAYDSTNWEPVL